jgi:hypothetical protein
MNRSAAGAVRERRKDVQVRDDARGPERRGNLKRPTAPPERQTIRRGTIRLVLPIATHVRRIAPPRVRKEFT